MAECLLVQMTMLVRLLSHPRNNSGGWVSGIRLVRTPSSRVRLPSLSRGDDLPSEGCSGLGGPHAISLFETCVGLDNGVTVSLSIPILSPVETLHPRR
jgi:hypothetical protein